MTGLTFEDYLIEELSYKRNFNFNPNIQKIDLNSDIEAEINIISENKADVSLNVIVGDLEKIDVPFQIKANIIGKFTFNEEHSNGSSFNDFLSENSIAILFPYLRNLISDISLKSNEFPSLIIPVINVVKLLKENNSITINDNTKNPTIE